jgi:cell division protein FtsL
MLIPNRTSAAYDFSLFESHEHKRKPEEPKIGIKTNNAPLSASRSGNVFKILLAAICAVMLPIYFLSSKVQLSELSIQISNTQLELSQAERENARLQAELDSIVTLAMVEDFAENTLGMQKITTTQGVHITMGAGGTTQIAEDLNNPVNIIAKWFSDTLEYLGFR